MGLFGFEQRRGQVCAGSYVAGRGGVFAADKILAKRRRPGQCQQQGTGERNGHRDRKSAEKAAGNAGRRDERQKDHDRRDCGADEGSGNFAESALNGLEARLAGVAVQHDVFENNDGVVDDKAYGGGEAAEGHQVETLPCQLENNQREQQCDGNDQGSDERRTPVPQEKHENCGGKNDAEQHGVAHAPDGVPDDGRLVVEGFKMHPGRKGGAELGDFLMDFVRDLQRVAVRLAIDAQQDGGLSVCGDHGVDGRFRGSHFGDVTEANGDSVARCLYDDLGNLLRCTNLAADETQHKLVLVFEQAGRIDQVGATNGVENVRDGDTGRVKPRRIGSDLKLGDASALHQDGGDAVQAIDARLEIVGGNFPEFVLGNAVRRQAVADDGKGSKRQAMGFDLGARGKFGLEAGDNGVDALQRKDHVGLPVEEEIDFSRTAARNGDDFLQAGNTVYSFFERAGNRDQHLIDRHDTVVDSDEDAWKVGVRKNGDRDAEGEISTNERKADGQEQNWPG